MRAVNLLPRETSSDRTPASTARSSRALRSPCSSRRSSPVASSSRRRTPPTQRQRLAAAQAALARAQSQQPSTHSPAPAQLQIPVVLSQQQPWHVALDAALSTRVAWDVLLRQLEYVVPDKVSLTNVTVGGAGASAGATSGTITIGGSAFSSNDVAVFLSTLAARPACLAGHRSSAARRAADRSVADLPDHGADGPPGGPYGAAARNRHDDHHRRLGMTLSTRQIRLIAAFRRPQHPARRRRLDRPRLAAAARRATAAARRSSRRPSSSSLNRGAAPTARPSSPRSTRRASTRSTRRFRRRRISPTSSSSFNRSRRLPASSSSASRRSRPGHRDRLHRRADQPHPRRHATSR